MIPYSFIATSHLAVTFGLSVSVFMIVVGQGWEPLYTPGHTATVLHWSFLQPFKQASQKHVVQGRCCVVQELSA